MSKTNVTAAINPFRRSNIESIISKYNFESNISIHLDILKDLCSDNVPNNAKLHLLLLLEENTLSWLLTAEDIEQVVGSLQSLYKQLLETKQILLCRQILITSTVVLLTAPNTDTDPQLCELLYKHVDNLLQIVTSAPSKNSPLLKLAACQCLQETESAFPGISFSSMSLESLWTACTNETSSAFQVYASLLALILRNTSNTREEVANNEGMAVSASPGWDGSLDRIPIAMYLVDLLPLLAPASLHTVLSCLMSGQEGKLKAFAMNLQIWIPSLFQSNYLPLNHLALCAIKAGFVSDTCGVKILLETANHPLTPIFQRLLILDWIEAAMEEKVWNVSDFPKGLCWTPNAFDGVDSQGKKLKLLCHVYSEETLQKVLLQFLESLQEAGGRATIVLYRTLLHFYLKLHTIKLENHICRVAVELLRASFGSIRHLLDFIEALRNNLLNSHLTEMILDRSISWMVEVPKAEAVQHLDSYLYGIQKIATFPESTPSRIKCQLQFLHGLLTFSNAYKDWLQGHRVLDAATMLLLRNDIALLYSDLGELLFLLLDSRESDVDVRNRAKICYAALTSVTSQKLYQLLPPDISKGSLTIPQFLTDHNTSSFPSANPLQTIPANVVSLERCKNIKTTKNIIPKTENGCDLNAYYETLPSVSVPLEFRLKLCPGRDTSFKVLYGLHLQIRHTDSANSAPESIYIPVLTEQHESDGYIFSFNAKPQQAQPLTLQFTLNVTTASYQSYSGDLGLMHIPLGEILLPLPIQDDLKALLYEELWKQSPQTQLVKESACSLSLSGKQLYTLWKDFFVTEETTDRRVGMFLVPSTHVLIKLTAVEESSVQILFKTDNWEAMPWFINYLNDIQML